MSPIDSGTPAIDSGIPAKDSGIPAKDSGTPAIDSGIPAKDSGTPAIDSGMPPHKICGQFDSVSDDNATEWRIDPSADVVTSSMTYSLFDTYNHQYLDRGTPTCGIQLGWNSNSPSNIRIQRKEGGPVNYGDMVAIKIDGSNYIKYGKYDWGDRWDDRGNLEKIACSPLAINLKMSSSPVYEWRVIGGINGTAIKTGTKVRLWNEVAKDNFVYCHREFGVDLAWSKDCANNPVGDGRRFDELCQYLFN